MEATRACAQQLEVLRLELTYAGRALQSARAVALQGWSGQARTAFTELYDECLDQAVALVREAGEMHASTVLVQGDVLAAHDQLLVAGWVNRAADVGLAVDALQAGLDPVTDVATAMVKGSARQVVAGVLAPWSGPSDARWPRWWPAARRWQRCARSPPMPHRGPRRR